MTDTSREAQLVEAFARLADTLVVDYDVFDLLQHLVDTCRDLFDVSAAGLLLADPQTGELDVVASTNEATRVVEVMQLSAQSGPCISAFRSGQVVSVPDVRQPHAEWDAFRSSALSQGFRSVYAIPLRLRSSTIGALNLFRESPGELNPRDVLAAQALTDVATIGILHERTLRAADVVQLQLQRALDSRVVIEQAKGVLAHVHDLEMDAAFELLRGFARTNRRPIRDVASALVDRSLIF